MRLLVVFLCLVVAGTAHAQMCGDSDGSGTITVTDGVNVLRQAAGLSSACSDDPSRCDVDGSGGISVTDGVNVLRRAAGLGASESCPAAGNDVARFAGRYQGTFSGDDHGDFDVEVDCDGEIEGSGYSSYYDEDFDIDGETTRDGEVTFTAGGTSSGSSFHGTVGEDGHVSGRWSNRGEGSDGTFSGSRTSQRSCS